jgi:dihydroorotase
MKTLIKRAKVYCKSSEYDQKIVDMFIVDGVIEKISEQDLHMAADEVITANDLAVSLGWIDASVCFGEPGLEDRETIAHGLQVAEKSGFTAICLNPNSQPVISSQEGVNFLIQKSKNSLVDLYPIGALTLKSEGEYLAELFDMHSAGAVAFTDYKKNLSHTNLMKIALQYTKDFDGFVMAFCQDQQLAGTGLVHEGLMSTKLGLKGIPPLAESIMVARNIELLKYTNHRLHISTISTKESLDLIEKAKNEGLNISCSVAAHHLVLTDENLVEFDANYKILPPLRDLETVKALRNGLIDGIIDSIVSDHQPLTIESKRLEFELAKFGTIGLESCFGSLNNVLPTEVVIEKLTSARKWLKLPEPQFAVGQKANLTLFETHTAWTFSSENILSTNKNSAFIGQKMKGNPIKIIN